MVGTAGGGLGLHRALMHRALSRCRHALRLSTVGLHMLMRDRPLTAVGAMMRSAGWWLCCRWWSALLVLACVVLCSVCLCLTLSGLLHDGCRLILGAQQLFNSTLLHDDGRRGEQRRLERRSTQQQPVSTTQQGGTDTALREEQTRGTQREGEATPRAEKRCPARTQPRASNEMLADPKFTP